MGQADGREVTVEKVVAGGRNICLHGDILHGKFVV